MDARTPREEFELPRDLGHVNAVPRTPTREPGQAHRLLVARAVLHFFAASSGLVATRTADGSEFRAFRIAFSMVMGASPF
jgi:hypothetical protein